MTAMALLALACAVVLLLTAAVCLERTRRQAPLPVFVVAENWTEKRQRMASKALVLCEERFFAGLESGDAYKLAQEEFRRATKLWMREGGELPSRESLIAEYRLTHPPAESGDDGLAIHDEVTRREKVPA